MSTFISYSRENHLVASLIRRELERSGLSVWMDDNSLDPGSHLTEVFEAVNNASNACIILSKDSVNSEWVRKELSLICTREIETEREILVPVVVEDCEIPFPLRDRSYLDFRNQAAFYDNMKKLVGKLGGYDSSTDPFSVLYNFNELVTSIRNENTSQIDILLVNGGATIPALIGPHLPELIGNNPSDKFSARLVLQELDFSKLALEHAFESGFQFNQSDVESSVSRKCYEALILESGCLQNIGIHRQQVERSVETMQNLASQNKDFEFKVRFTSRLPFCRLIITDNVCFYTPFLSSLPFNFFTLRLPVFHPFFARCKDHFEALFSTGEDSLTQ